MNRKQRRTERKLGGGGVVASSPAQALFADAVGHHQAGRLAEAERLYRSALTINPRHDDSLHLLGVIASQSGRHDVAVELIRKAIAIIWSDDTIDEREKAARAAPADTTA